MLWHRPQTFAGQFSDVTMVQTRRKRDEAKAELDDGIDLVAKKRQRRLKAELAAQTTFAGGAGYGAGNRA